jgi:hypothetical protein
MAGWADENAVSAEGAFDASLHLLSLLYSLLHFHAFNQSAPATAK